MDLRALIKQWLKDEMPNWEVRYIATGYYIVYKDLGQWNMQVFDDRVEVDECKRDVEPFVIYAYDKRFFELLWNRLYVMELGFKKAVESRNFHRPESR